MRRYHTKWEDMIPYKQLQKKLQSISIMLKTTMFIYMNRDRYSTSCLHSLRLHHKPSPHFIVTSTLMLNNFYRPVQKNQQRSHFDPPPSNRCWWLGNWMKPRRWYPISYQQQQNERHTGYRNVVFGGNISWLTLLFPPPFPQMGKKRIFGMFSDLSTSTRPCTCILFWPTSESDE